MSDLKEWLECNCCPVFSGSAEDFLDLLRELEQGYKDMEAYKKDPSGWDEESMELLAVDIPDMEEQISHVRYWFLKDHEGTDWKKEVALLRDSIKR